MSEYSKLSRGVLSVPATLLSRVRRDLLLKERICSSSRSKFFPLRVDPMPKGYPIQSSKNKFMQVNKTLFLKKRHGEFRTAGEFLGSVWYIKININH